MGIALSEQELGPPDLKIAGLQLWVHGRQYPDAVEDYDADWLRITAHCGASSASVWVSGALLSSWSFVKFARDCESLLRTLQGKAQLWSHEPELVACLEASDTLGHIKLTVDITPDHMTQQHRFEFEDLDQSYLPGVLSMCEGILTAYPTKLTGPK
jgi:hypothetical protein